MRPEEACGTLERNGYGGVFSGELVDGPARPGRVVGQHPQPGSPGSEEGRIVDLLVSPAQG